MRLEDKLYLTQSKRVVSGLPSYMTFPSVGNRDINELIRILEEKDIMIFQNDSERQIRYNINNEWKSSLVPIGVTFERSEVKTVGYVLRGAGLEFHLKDYRKSQPDRPDMIGGPSYAEGGIIFKFILEGNEMSELSSKLETLKDVVVGFYKVEDVEAQERIESVRDALENAMRK